MRETNEIRNARSAELDPYRRRFVAPRWNRTVTVTDVPRLFRRLPEFADWTADRHVEASKTYLEASRIADVKHLEIITSAQREYGDRGSLISGGFRDHWPDSVKDDCRRYARLTSDCLDKSRAHWQAAGRRLETFRRLITG